MLFLKSLTVVEFDPSALSSSRARLPAAGSREHMSDQASLLTGSQFALGPSSALLSSSSQSRSRSVLQLPSPLSRLDEAAAGSSATNSPSKRRRFGANGVPAGGDSSASAEQAADVDVEREQLLEQQQQLMHQHMHEHLAQRPAEKHVVLVLDCDSVSQVKRKICSALYEHEAFSSRPHLDAHELGK